MTSGRPSLLWVNWRDLDHAQAGGAEVHTHEVLRRLVARGWNILWASHAEAGLPTHDSRSGYSILRSGGALTFNFTVWRNLPKWIRLLRPDVIVDDSNKIPFCLPWRTRVPVVAMIHHLFGSAIWRQASLPVAAYVALAEKLVPPAYRKVPVMTGSPSARAELMSLGLSDVTDVGEGVDLTGLHPPAPGERDPLLLFYLGRLKRYKGLDVLLHGFARLRASRPGLRLWIAGTGDDRPRLEAIGQSLSLGDELRFLGFVTESDKRSLLARAAVVLNTSIKEGWGLTSLEAGACHTPVVASDVPGLCDSVRHGETGFLFPLGDHKALALAVAEILDDEALARRMGTAGRQMAETYTWDAVAQRTEKILLRGAGLGARAA